MAQDKAISKMNTLLKEQGASDDDMKYWQTYIATVPEKFANYIIAFLTLFPGEVSWLRDINERKQKALRTKDQKAWEEILTEESRRISSLLLVQ